LTRRLPVGGLELPEPGHPESAATPATNITARAHFRARRFIGSPTAPAYGCDGDPLDQTVLCCKVDLDAMGFTLEKPAAPGIFTKSPQTPWVRRVAAGPSHWQRAARFWFDDDVSGSEVIDFQRQVITVRILYFGATGSGATQTVRALAAVMPTAVREGPSPNDPASPIEQVTLDTGSIRDFAVSVKVTGLESDSRAVLKEHLRENQGLVFVVSPTCNVAMTLASFQSLDVALGELGRNPTDELRFCQLSWSGSHAPAKVREAMDHFRLGPDFRMFLADPQTGAETTTAFKEVVKTLLKGLRARPSGPA
jgi:hypothetical protein